MKVKEESEKIGLKLNVQKTKIMASSPITSWQIDGEPVETVTDSIFLGSRITADGDCSHEIKRPLLLGRKAMTNIDSILKSRDITNKSPSSPSYGFSSSHVWMWALDVKKVEHQRIDVFEVWCWRRLLRVPWTARRSNQSLLKDEYSLEGTGAEAEAPILWSPDMKNRFIGKDPDAGTDWRQEEKGVTEDEMAGWHHWLNGHEFEQTPGVVDGQRSLVCYSLRGCKELDTTELLNWTEKSFVIYIQGYNLESTKIHLIVLWDFFF